jgi:uncharacterized protein YcfJ
MKPKKWIRDGVVIALIGGFVGVAHAQSSMLRAAPAVGGGFAAANATHQVVANDAVWNYFTGLVSQAVEKAMKISDPDPTPTLMDDRLFDR